MQPTSMGGPAEVALKLGAGAGITIPSTMLSEVAAEFVEGTRSRSTLGGNFTRPSGKLDTAQVRFTLFLPSMDYLKNIFPGRYNAPTAPATAGNVIINANNSVSTEAGKVNIHFTSEDLDNNDLFMYNAQALLNFSPTWGTDDDLSIEVTLLAQPDANGNIARIGTGDLTANSKYDAATGTTTVIV
jgi:hypothetical protein